MSDANNYDPNGAPTATDGNNVFIYAATDDNVTPVQDFAAFSLKHFEFSNSNNNSDFAFTGNKFAGLSHLIFAGLFGVCSALRPLCWVDRVVG